MPCTRRRGNRVLAMKGDRMTFGKCVWDGCTRHAEKESTGACRNHHQKIREARCMACQGPLRNRVEIERGRCPRCPSSRAA